MKSPRFWEVQFRSSDVCLAPPVHGRQQIRIFLLRGGVNGMLCARNSNSSVTDTGAVAL